MSWDSKIEVTLKVVIDTETDSHPDSLSKASLKGIITDVVADQISQFDDGDLSAAISKWKIIETKKED
jgi:hypothetical protein